MGWLFMVMPYERKKKKKDKSVFSNDKVITFLLFFQ